MLGNRPVRVGRPDSSRVDPGHLTAEAIEGGQLPDRRRTSSFGRLVSQARHWLAQRNALTPFANRRVDPATAPTMCRPAATKIAPPRFIAHARLRSLKRIARRDTSRGGRLSCMPLHIAVSVRDEALPSLDLRRKTFVCWICIYERNAHSLLNGLTYAESAWIRCLDWSISDIVDKGLGWLRLDHVAIAAEDPKAASNFWGRLFGLELDHWTISHDGGFRVAQFHLPNRQSGLELIAPFDESSFVQKFIDERGPGMHHITVEVEDADAACEYIREELASEPLGGKPNVRL